MSNIKVEYSFTTQEKHSSVVCFNYVYNWKASNKNSKRYKCIKCNATVTVDESDLVIKINGNKCNNDAGQEDIKKSHDGCTTVTAESLAIKDSVREIKRRVETEASVLTVQQIYQQEKSKFVKKYADKFENIHTVFPTFYEKQSGLYDARQKLYPPIPSTLDELVIEGRWSETETNERFLVEYIKEPKLYALILCSDAGLLALSKSKLRRNIHLYTKWFLTILYYSCVL